LKEEGQLEVRYIKEERSGDEVRLVLKWEQQDI